MLQKIYFYVLIFGLLTLYTCVEPFTPEINDYEEVLVVDGIITDEKGPHQVLLNKTFRVDSTQSKPETGAKVEILSQNGQVINLEEVYPGTYLTDSSISGSPGEFYKLKVITKGGTIIESGYTELIKSPSIDTIYYEYQEKEADNGEKYDIIQLFMDTHDETDKSHYYRYEWKETWEFNVPLRDSLNRSDTYICWKNSSSSQIVIANTADQLTSRIIKLPFYLITEETNRLSRLYSIQVKQYALTEEIYYYYKDLERMNESLGTIFDPIPTTVYGNVFNISNPDKPVLGVFQACGISKKRAFIQRNELPRKFNPSTGYEDCIVQYVETSSERNRLLQTGWIYLYEATIGTDSVYVMTNFSSCYDCTQRGTNIRPPFWPIN